jgi:hypothetical protein
MKNPWAGRHCSTDGEFKRLLRRLLCTLRGHVPLPIEWNPRWVACDYCGSWLT